MALARGATITGGRVSGTGPLTLSGAVNQPTSDANTLAVVGVVISVSSNSSSTTCAVTYGGDAMSLLGTLQLMGSSTSRSAVGIFYKYGPKTGSQDIVVTPGGSSTKAAVAAGGQVYTGVDATIGARFAAAATGLTVPTQADGAAFVVTTNGAALSSPNQNSLYLGGASVGGVGDYCSVQDRLATAPSCVFTNTGTGTTPETLGVALAPIQIAESYVINTASNQNLGSATSISCNKPANTVDGDIMIAIEYGEGAAASFTAPDANWVSVGTQNDNGTHPGVYVWRKIASGEGSSYTFGKANGGTAITILTVRGALKKTVANWTFAATPTHTNATTRTAPSISATGVLLVSAACVNAANNTSSQIFPTAMYRVVDYAAGSYEHITIATLDSPPNPTVARDFTATVAPTGGIQISILIPVGLPPTLTNVDPASGYGGQTATLTGTNFDVGTPTVSFGGTAATNISVTNATTLTCTIPNHAVGAVNVTVTNDDGTSGTFSFTYTEPPFLYFKSVRDQGGDSTSEILIPVPPNGAAGDGLLAFIEVYNSAGGTPSASPPDATWYQVPSSPIETSYGTAKYRLYIFRHRDPGTDSGNYTFTLTGHTWRDGTVVRYGNIIDDDDFIDVDSSAHSWGAALPACPSMDTTTPNTKLVYIAHAADDFDDTLGYPDGWNFVDISNYGDNTRAISDKEQAEPGATGDVSTTSPGNNAWIVWMGALRPPIGPRFAAAGTGVPNAGGTVASIALPRPASGGTGTGIVDLACIYTETGTTVTPPGGAGWADAPDSPVVVTGARAHQLNVFWKEATSSAGSDTFSFSPNQYAAGIQLRYKDVDSADPFDVTTSAIDTTTLHNTTPAVSDTTTGPNRRIVLAVTQRHTSAVSATPPTNFDERADIGNNGAGVEVSDNLQLAEGATGSLSATYVASNAMAAWLGALQGVSTGPPEGDTSGAYGWAGTAAGSRMSLGTTSGAFGWAGTAVGDTPPNEGTAAGAYGWAGTAVGETTPLLPNEASASGSFGWSGTAAGSRDSDATASGSFGWAGSASGTAEHEGSASGAYGWAGTAVGETPPNTGSASGTFGWAGTAAGSRDSDASASGDYGWAGSATGSSPNGGTTAGSYGWAGAAVGEVPPNAGSAAGSYGWTGTAVGETPPNSGSASGSFGWSGTAVGSRDSVGTASGEHGWAGTAVGETPAVGLQEGWAAGSYGWSGIAVGSRDSVGTASGEYGFSGVAAGSRESTGTTSGTFGWSGTAAGSRESAAASSGQYGWSGTAVGEVPPNAGTASGSFGWAGSASGSRESSASSAGNYGWEGSAEGSTPLVGMQEGWAGGNYGWTGTAAGSRESSAQAAGSYGWSGTAAGETPPNSGSASGAFGWSGTAAGSRKSSGTAAGSFGWSSSASGGRASLASAAGAYGWAGTVEGRRPLIGPGEGQASGAFGWSGTAVGKRVPKANAAGSHGWVGTAVGATSKFGAAAGVYGWIGSAVGKLPTESGTMVLSDRGTSTLMLKNNASGDIELNTSTLTATMVDVGASLTLTDQAPVAGLSTTDIGASLRLGDIP